VEGDTRLIISSLPTTEPFATISTISRQRLGGRSQRGSHLEATGAKAVTHKIVRSVCPYRRWFLGGACDTSSNVGRFVGSRFFVRVPFQAFGRHSNAPTSAPVHPFRSALGLGLSEITAGSFSSTVLDIVGHSCDLNAVTVGASVSARQPPSNRVPFLQRVRWPNRESRAFFEVAGHWLLAKCEPRGARLERQVSVVVRTKCARCEPYRL
jgi:hypothetical protein